MKINIFKYFLLLLGFLISLIFYLSIVGIETDKFNQQIKDTVVQSNNNLDVSLKKVKLILDPLKLKINAKTIGANIYYANRPLELEYIKTQVSLDSLLKNKLVSSNFEVATKSILLKDLIQIYHYESINTVYPQMKRQFADERRIQSRLESEKKRAREQEKIQQKSTHFLKLAF